MPDLAFPPLQGPQAGAGIPLGIGAAYPCGGSVTAGSHPEGGAASAEGAGLVPYKTTPNAAEPSDHSEAGQGAQSHQDPPGSHRISFDKQTCTANRLKRLRRNVWLSGYLHNMPRKGHRQDVPWFVTLTYRCVDDWRPQHIGRCMDKYRRWCARKGVACRYTWVAELQNRGAVHYHLMVWLPVGVRMPMWDKTTTYRGRTQEAFWIHGMTNRQVAKTGIAYLMKYLSKMGEFHEFPEGCRTSGMGGLDDHSRLIRSWMNLPEWAKREYGVGDLTRINGALYVLATGERLLPMYRRVFDPGSILLIPIREIPERRHDGPYSTWSAT